ncbi:hypothetical protein JYK22_26020, partial [Nonomuraea sp. RK-328]|nr:hypothetical protein [Nonomuraea sp. RK-328]
VDRNEVVLAGRVSVAAEDKRLPSGDTLTRWRLAVRRDRPHPKGGVMTDSIPCITFAPEVAAVVREVGPDDPLEIRGAFRCRIYGPSSAKIWRYEVEVFSAEPVDVDRASPPLGARRRTTRGSRTPKPSPTASVTAAPGDETVPGQDRREDHVVTDQRRPGGDADMARNRRSGSLPPDPPGAGACAASPPAVTELPAAELESLVDEKSVTQSKPEAPRRPSEQEHEPTPRNDPDTSKHAFSAPNRLQVMIDTCKSAGRGVLSRTGR